MGALHSLSTETRILLVLAVAIMQPCSSAFVVHPASSGLGSRRGCLGVGAAHLRTKSTDVLAVSASLEPAPIRPGRRVLAAGTVGMLLLQFAGPNRANAEKGDFAKIDVGKMVDDYAGEEKKGPSLYDAESDKVRRARLASINKEWVKLVKEVDAALSASICTEAKSSLALRMGTIKGYMREVSRLAADGDILVRDRGADKSANFDYASGTFEYKAVAQLPEDMFAEINYLSEACRLKVPEEAMQRWEAAKGIFAKWTVMVQ